LVLALGTKPILTAFALSGFWAISFGEKIQLFEVVCLIKKMPAYETESIQMHGENRRNEDLPQGFIFSNMPRAKPNYIALKITPF